LGGTVTAEYHDRQRIHQLLNPHKYISVPDTILPPTTKLIGQYADESRRGYLAPLVKEVDRKDILETVLKEVAQIRLKSPRLK
jgi:hypothetical protein